METREESRSSAALRRAGHAVTRGRGEILRILSESPIPLSPKEILARFPSPKPDAATVYRNLSLLTSLGVVRSVALHERSRRYESAVEGAHRHRVVCRGCGLIESFEPGRCDLSRIEADIRAALGFEVIDHSLEFFGRCLACASRGARG
jgi:Fur family ferric uptake transcriptional regulator